MSSGEEFEVGEILEQRKRKGVLEYLVRWQGFGELYDSWEPAAGLSHCATAIKAFLAKNKRSKSKSRSRSRSRGRAATKSKSRSRSRGRTSKSGSTPTRSRSRSASRKTTQSSTKTSRKSTSEVVVAKTEASLAERESRGRARTQVSELKASESKTEVVLQRASTTREGGTLERKTEVVKKSMETIRSTPVRAESTTMTTRSRLAVRQVENDQKPAPKRSPGSERKEMWLWWFADHAVLLLFIVISIIALSFTIESVSEVRDKLIPDMGVLRQRLGESYEHFVQSISLGFKKVVDVLPSWGDEAASASQKSAPPPKGT